MANRLEMDVKTAARVLLSKSKISKKPNVVLVGSNYNMFRKYKEDPHCTKCADSFEIIEPTPVDVFTFEVSLAARRMLADKGIPATVLIMPSDFMKGADWEQLDVMRKSYRLPDSFRELLDRYNVPSSGVAFSFESSFRSRAQTILRRILRNPLPPQAMFHVRFSLDSTDLVLSDGSDMLISLGMIPIGRMIEGSQGAFPVPFCQILCSAFYERLGKTGFTDMLGFFNESEKICLGQGTYIAQTYGYLGVRVQLSFFRETGTGFELIGLTNYPQEGV